jgi:hypothetical protein
MSIDGTDSNWPSDLDVLELKDGQDFERIAARFAPDLELLEKGLATFRAAWKITVDPHAKNLLCDDVWRPSRRVLEDAITFVSRLGEQTVPPNLISNHFTLLLKDALDLLPDDAITGKPYKKQMLRFQAVANGLMTIDGYLYGDM